MQGNLTRIDPVQDARDRLRARLAGIHRGAYRDLRIMDDADLDRIERFAGHSPAGVLRTEPAPPQVRGIPLEPHCINETSVLIKLKPNRYAAGENCQWADVPAVNNCRGEKV
jgi:hypothetical protein